VHRRDRLDRLAGALIPGERNATARSGPERLVRFLARRGPLFVKMGQFLALRPDVLPQAYCEALLQLVDRAPAIEWKSIEQILTEDLGAPPARVFRHIDKRALAAGSIAQVHLAETHRGEAVAVKVQRPNLRAQVDRDVRLARRLARFLEVFRIGPLVAPRDVVDEVEDWLRQELDFARELDNQTRMYDALKTDSRVRIPRPFVELSAARVVTSEYIKGVPFSELVRRSGAAQRPVTGDLAVDADVLAENLLLSLFHQVFRVRRFHADPHPGNLVALPGGVVGFVDFGLVDTLPANTEEVQASYLNALYNNDVHGMYVSIIRILEPTQDTDLEPFRRDFYEETNRWLARLEDDVENTSGRSTTGSYLVVLMRLARLHRMRVPRSILALYRTLLTAETVAYQIGGTATLRSVGRRFFAGYPIERFLRELTPDRLTASLMQLAEIARSAPGQVQEILSDLAEGRFVLAVRSEESEKKRRANTRRTRMLALAIVSTGIAALLTGADRLDPTLSSVLWAVLAALYVGIAVLWWRLR
jgi:ubiquinone biosynthesis protein